MIRKIRLLFVLFLFWGIALEAQELIKPEDLVRKAMEENIAESVEPFELMENISNERSKIMPDFVEAKISNSFYEKMLSSKSDFIEMKVPTSSREEVILQLVKINVFDQNDHVIAYPEKKKISVNPGLHYRGIIKGDEKSLVAISIFEDEIMGLVAGYKEANLVIGKSEESERHLIYLDNQISKYNKWECDVEDDAISYTEEEITYSNHERAAQKCVRLYIEVNYDIYRRRGNMTNTSNFVTGFMNQVMALYSRESIKTSLSPLVIWNRNSPYTGTNTRALLSQFGNYRKSFNGDLAQLVTFQGSGGLAAGFNGICNSYTPSRLSVSSISNYYSTIPTYSWTVGVVAHEFGHIFGSRHTHACVWNGNGTAIDGCAGFVEGNCSLPGSPSNGGTIMSYCHTVSVGMNLSLGFGRQPGNVIRSRVANGRCLGTCDNGGGDGDQTCDTPTNLNITNITQSTARVNWSSVANANNYTVGVKKSTNSTYTSGNINSTYANVSQLQSNTAYNVRVRANCQNGSSSYATTSFKTSGSSDPEPRPCNAPTGLQSSNTTSNSTKLIWNSVSGANSYTLTYKKSTSSNYKSVNVSTTYHNLNNLEAGVKYDWNVRTNCSGNHSNYSSSYFTTQQAVQNCEKPKYLVASALSSITAMINIGTVEGATNYKIQYKAYSSSNWRSVNFSTYGNTILYNLQANTKYTVRVATVCNENLSEYVITNFTTPELCNSSFDSGVMETNNNNLSSAPEVPLNLDFKGSISSWLDVDYYKFTINSNSNITIDLTNLTRDYDMTLLNSSASVIASSKNSWTSNEKIVKTLSAGTYYVKIHGYFFSYDKNNCYNLKISSTNSSSSMMDVSGMNKEIEIYPNPVIDVLYINLDGSKLATNTKLNIADSSAKIVYSQNLDTNSKNQKLNVEHLRAGMYLLFYYKNGEKITYKFIKK